MTRYLRLAAALAVLAVLLGTGTRADEKKKDDDDAFASLIGKPAPEITAEFGLNGKVVKLADLKGKVVLVDFWAVWCGPCVASFPHLAELNKEYKDKGLEIVGVTQFEGRFSFDKEAGKLKREKVTRDEEQTMLKDFAAHHKLEHRLLTMDKDAAEKTFMDYKVEGIPQIVLIDRKGIVRMIKVGKSEENDKAVDEMVKKLIAEK